MFSKIISKFDDWVYYWGRQLLPVLDWQPLVDEIAPVIEDHSIFLETRHDGFVPLADYTAGESDQQIVAIAVALVRKELEPWDTEVPAKEMAEKLSRHLGRPLPRLISRQWRVFAGHYVHIIAEEDAADT